MYHFHKFISLFSKNLGNSLLMILEVNFSWIVVTALFINLGAGLEFMIVPSTNSVIY